MAEDKRANPFPYLTAEEFAASEGTPTRAFLLGDNDHSPMMKGVLDLTTLCYKLLDEHAQDPNASDTFVELRDMLEDHGCPTSAAS